VARSGVRANSRQRTANRKAPQSVREWAHSGQFASLSKQKGYKIRLVGSC